MKTDQSQNRIGNAILVFSLLFGIGIALSMTAQAQYPDDRYNQDRNRSDNGDQNRRGRDWDRYANLGQAGRSVFPSNRCQFTRPLNVQYRFVRVFRPPNSAILGDSIFVCELAHRQCSLKGSFWET